MTISAPQPTVVHLFTIFRQIGSGELRIPAFQREFVWKDRQVIDLLKSVREQFPIGSVLLWHVDKKMLEIASHEVTAFPDVLESFPTNYVLDGMQRLSTLFGAFHYERGQPSIFDVHYDLRTKRFSHGADLDGLDSGAWIPLAALLSPRRTLEHQARLSQLPDGDPLLDELLSTQAAFQDYMIPIVTIRSSDVDRIVEIFERTNSTGTRLDTVDFMRAITWNQSFDLNRHLDATRAPLIAGGYELSDETMIKCIGLLLDVPPTADGLLSLRSRTPQELQQAFESFPSKFDRVIRFLKDRFKIENLAYVPYEGQILVLFKSIGMEEVERPSELDQIERWFWAIGFNESLRGKPDHYVVRAVENWRSLVTGQIRGLEPRLRLSTADFLDRRLIKGKALSASFAAMFATKGAKSLLTGDVIPTVIYMSAPDMRSFLTICSGDELKYAGMDVGPSPRIFPNLVVGHLSEKRSADLPDIKTRISELLRNGQTDVLASQFIDKEAAQKLGAGRVAEFLRRRAELLQSAAQQLVGTGPDSGSGSS